MAARKQTDETVIAVMGGDVARIKSDVNEIKQNMAHNYVTVEAFEPIKRLVYGLVSLILTGFVVGCLALVINR